MTEVQGTALWLAGPRQVEHRPATFDAPQFHQLQIRTVFSALSHGTERLAFRGEIDPALPLDLPSFKGSFGFPLKYGYACTGIVEAIGSDVHHLQPGDRVFALHPHQDLFAIDDAYVIQLPDSVPLDLGVFFAQIETAVNVLLDAAPRIQETVVVFGQGVVGLLITSLLARMNLAQIIAVDPVLPRRVLAQRMGATHRLAPTPELPDTVHSLTEGRGADLVIEVSGVPLALNQAIDCAAIEGTVVIASWYGTRPVTLQLGSAFHRRRLRLISSQVGMVQPSLGPRWDRQRRSEAARAMLAQLDLGSLITHRVPFRTAQDAYALLDAPPDDLVQVILTYDDQPCTK
ncbi:MAG: zinc-binding dehydrogenase [Chloroflexota bacterium]